MAYPRHPRSDSSMLVWFTDEVAVATPRSSCLVDVSLDWMPARCTYEGRMTAMRWLILFVGLKGDKKCRPVVEELTRDTDMRIDRLGGTLFSVGRAEACTLAKVWVGCSQATSHPTLGTNHPQIDPPALAEALGVIIDHLQRKLYAPHGRDLFADVMAPFYSGGIGQTK